MYLVLCGTYLNYQEIFKGNGGTSIGWVTVYKVKSAQKRLLKESRMNE